MYIYTKSFEHPESNENWLMGMIVNWHEALIDTFQLVMQRVLRAFD